MRITTGSASGDYTDYPQEANILAAAKITGRLQSRTSVAFLAAATDDETAKVKVGIVLGGKYKIKTNEEPVVIQDLFSRNTSIDFIPAGTNAPVIEPPPGEIPKLKPPVSRPGRCCSDRSPSFC